MISSVLKREVLLNFCLLAVDDLGALSFMLSFFFAGVKVCRVSSGHLPDDSPSELFYFQRLLVDSLLRLRLRELLISYVCVEACVGGLSGSDWRLLATSSVNVSSFVNLTR